MAGPIVPLTGHASAGAGGMGGLSGVNNLVTLCRRELFLRWRVARLGLDARKAIACLIYGARWRSCQNRIGTAFPGRRGCGFVRHDPSRFIPIFSMTRPEAGFMTMELLASIWPFDHSRRLSMPHSGQTNFVEAADL